MRLIDRWLSETDDPVRATLVRGALFGVLAWDAWADIPHAARYGAGNFNVSHFAWMDAVLGAPDRGVILGLTLLQVFLAIRVMVGTSVRSSLTLMSLSSAYVYFCSQLDSYQHHYLTVVLIGIMAVGSWLSPRGRLAPWVHWMLRAQIALVYLWAAVAKLDPGWRSGSPLQRQIQPEWAQAAIQDLAQTVGATELAVYGALATSVLVVEVLLAGMWMRRSTWWLAFPLGLGFHASVELLEFKVGRFSWIMAALYLLILPDGLARRLRPFWEKEPRDRTIPIPVAVGLAAAVGVLWLALPFPELRWIALLVGGLAGVDLVRRPSLRAGGLQIAGLAGLLILTQGSEVPRDYYKYLGGDARRRNEVDSAIAAYERAVQVSPEYFSGWVRLGDLYLRAGDTDSARESYLEAQSINPTDDVVIGRLKKVKATPVPTDP